MSASETRRTAGRASSKWARYASEDEAIAALLHDSVEDQGRYERSARELWKFCGQTGSGWEVAAGTLEFLREQGEEAPDWWAAGEPRRR